MLGCVAYGCCCCFVNGQFDCGNDVRTGYIAERLDWYGAEGTDKGFFVHIVGKYMKCPSHADLDQAIGAVMAWCDIVGLCCPFF